MDRSSLLALLAGKIAATKAPGRPCKVGIDGRCAAGKSTLADELAALLTAMGLDVLRPSVDGFHHPREHRYRQGEYSAVGYYEDAFDYDKIVRVLLEPLSGIVFPAECRQVGFDLRTNMPVDAPPVYAGPNAVLLFDGVFIFRRALNRYWDYRILVDADSETVLTRALARDIGFEPLLIRRKYEERYEPAWLHYVAEEHPEEQADVIIDNCDVRNPRIIAFGNADKSACRAEKRGPS
jgi:uridine kinase